MANEQPLLPEKRHIPNVTRGTPPEAGATALSTRDHEVIRDWARAVAAEPATAEETASGPAPSSRLRDLPLHDARSDADDRAPPT